MMSPSGNIQQTPVPAMAGGFAFLAPWLGEVDFVQAKDDGRFALVVLLQFGYASTILLNNPSGRFHHGNQ